MRATKLTITFDRHVWTMPSPVDHLELEETVAAAMREKARLPHAGDVWISGEGDKVTVWFETRHAATDGADDAGA